MSNFINRFAEIYEKIRKIIDTYKDSIGITHASKSRQGNILQIELHRYPSSIDCDRLRLRYHIRDEPNYLGDNNSDSVKAEYKFINV